MSQLPKWLSHKKKSTEVEQISEQFFLVSTMQQHQNLSEQRAALDQSQGLVKILPGWLALLHLLCSRARKNLQEEPLKRNKQNLDDRPSTAGCTHTVNTINRSLSQLPKSFSHNSLDRGAAKLGRAVRQQAASSAAAAMLIRRTPSMELSRDMVARWL